MQTSFANRFHIQRQIFSKNFLFKLWPSKDGERKKSAQLFSVLLGKEISHF